MAIGPTEIGDVGVPKWCMRLAEEAAPNPDDRTLGRNLESMMDMVRLQANKFMRMGVHRSLDLFECFFRRWAHEPGGVEARRQG